VTQRELYYCCSGRGDHSITPSLPLHFVFHFNHPISGGVLSVSRCSGHSLVSFSQKRATWTAQEICESLYGCGGGSDSFFDSFRFLLSNLELVRKFIPHQEVPIPHERHRRNLPRAWILSWALSSLVEATIGGSKQHKI